jgi:hypothetical protein
MVFASPKIAGEAWGKQAPTLFIARVRVTQRLDLDRHSAPDVFGLIGRQGFEAGAELPPVIQSITLEIAGYSCSGVRW